MMAKNSLNDQILEINENKGVVPGQLLGVFCLFWFSLCFFCLFFLFFFFLNVGFPIDRTFLDITQVTGPNSGVILHTLRSRNASCCVPPFPSVPFFLSLPLGL